MIIDDRGNRYQVIVLGVPEFPRHLEDRLQVAQEADEDEAKAFLAWWGPACTRRGFIHGRFVNAEEWVHARRLLTRYEIDRLKTLAVDFFTQFAKEEWQGPQLMRMFYALIPEIEAWRKRG